MALTHQMVAKFEALITAIQKPFYFRQAKFFKVIKELKLGDFNKDFYWKAGYGDVGVYLLDFYPLLDNIDTIICFEKKMKIWVARVLPDELVDVLFLGDGTPENRVKNFEELISSKANMERRLQR